MEALPPAARGTVGRGGHCPARAQSLLPQGRSPLERPAWHKHTSSSATHAAPSSRKRAGQMGRLGRQADPFLHETQSVVLGWG